MAVLINSRTASAAEFTAICLKTIKNVRFFGEPTSGLTTRNIRIILPDGAILIITSAIIKDKYGTIIEGKIHPEVFIANQNGNDKNLDAVVAAKEWIVKE